jgi:hypothetical protein
MMENSFMVFHLEKFENGGIQVRLRDGHNFLYTQIKYQDQLQDQAVPSSQR